MEEIIQRLKKIVSSEKKELEKSLGIPYEEIEPTVNCIWHYEERI